MESKFFCEIDRFLGNTRHGAAAALLLHAPQGGTFSLWPIAMKDARFTSIVFLSLGFAAGAALHGAEPGAKTSGSVHFNRDIRPIMSDTCFLCHGPDKHSRKGGLEGKRLLRERLGR